MSISTEDNSQTAPGNPTTLRDALDPGEDRLLSRILVDKAKGGDAVAVRFVVGHLYPRPRARPIVLDVPADMRPGNVVAVFDAALRAMAAGEITPEEARAVTWVLDGRKRVLEAWEREHRLRCCHDFVAGGAFLPEKPHFPTTRQDDGGDNRDDEEDPPGFAEAWARYQVRLREHEALKNQAASVSPAPVSPAGGVPAASPPANHLHPQEAPRPAAVGAAPERHGAAPNTAAGATDPLHSACIQQAPAARTLAGAALKREFVAAMSQLP
jgi:hypothetical protein